MSFTFEKDFSIKYCEHGGYILTQTNFVEKTHQLFEKAFTNLEDLTRFLLAAKEAYETGMR